MQQAASLLATDTSAPQRYGGRYRTRLARLRSEWPLMLRRTLPPAPGPLAVWAGRDTDPACVHQAAGAAGPLGGDRLRLEVSVGAGSALVLGEVAPTLLLPGPRGEVSRLEIRIDVGERGTLAWLPELVIAASGCRHVTDVRVDLAPGARLILREEVLFGRHGERPGSYRQRLRVRSAGVPLHDQELSAGPDAPGWAGPAVTAGLPAVGTLLVVDPAVRAPDPPYDQARDAKGVLMRLAGHGLLFSSLAQDTATLRRSADEMLARLLSAGAGIGHPAVGSTAADSGRPRPLPAHADR